MPTTSTPSRAGRRTTTSGAGEAPGQWLGSGCAALGLTGEVGAEALRAVLAGVDPRTGERLGRAGNRRTPGFDLTFRPPKSVSVLYGLGAPSVAAAVKVAHDAAVGEALGYLEREAAWSRRGHDGHERVAIEGFVAAAFVHRTSRAGDPLLHTHVVVANVARARDDGQWRTLDGRLLYTHAKTAGYLYQAQLRHELAARLRCGVGAGHARLRRDRGDPARSDRRVFAAAPGDRRAARRPRRGVCPGGAVCPGQRPVGEVGAAGIEPATSPV